MAPFASPPRTKAGEVHRVIYRPDTELTSHYSDASLPQQLGAYLWFDETKAVTRLDAEHVRAGVPDTYPFGL